MQNIHPSPTRHFSFSPQEQLRVLKEFSHLQIIGIYHSHPLSPPTPSQEDEPQARHQRALQAARRRALSSALLRELRDELGDGPELLGGTAPHRELQR